MNTVMLSDHFSLQEAITSDTAARKGIVNVPDAATLDVMMRTAVKLEKVRQLLLSPIHVNSWYRCPELNTAIGSKSTSQHVKGEAVDFIAPAFGSPLDVCRALVAEKELIGFDQLILEHSWIHISFSILDKKPRGHVLSLLATGHYANGLTNKEGKPY